MNFLTFDSESRFNEAVEDLSNVLHVFLHVTRRGDNAYNAVAMPIKKSGGGYRVVLDYRALNLNTTRDTYPLPNIDSHLFSLGKANLFTTIDLLMGFHQCELDDESKPKTAFNGGSFMPVKRGIDAGLARSFSSVISKRAWSFSGLAPASRTFHCGPRDCP